MDQQSLRMRWLGAPVVQALAALLLGGEARMVFTSVPVFPSSGPLFPDFDCRSASRTGDQDGIDWAAWLHIFEDIPSKEWGDHSNEYLEKFMDSDAETYLRYISECPLGVLNAELLLYVTARYQGEDATAAAYASVARQGLARFPLHVLTGSKWPLIGLLTADKLRRIRPDGREIADDPRLNCAEIPEPALNWLNFRDLFADGRRKDWYGNSIKYVFSWQMGQIPDALAEECPLGVLTATMIKAFTCATSESTCYADQARIIERWLKQDPDAFEVLAHSRWPLAIVINHMARASRHRFFLDFTEAELAGAPSEALRPLFGSGADGLAQLGPWAGSLAGHSQSFRDLIAALPRLGAGPTEAPHLVYITMIYGARFNRHLKRFCARARALGPAGGRLLLFTLDEEAFNLCQQENGQRCVRGTPSIMNKFTLPLMCARLGLDAVWVDLDVFLMSDPTAAIVEHAQRGPFDILISGSYEADCICNGIVYFRATEVVRTWLLGVLVWMYNHPYEHDQKTFSAFLNYTETVSREPLDFPEIPPWDTLDPINQFVTPDTFEGNGWSGSLDNIVIYHFLNGESDTGSDLDPSGTWMREHGHFEPGSGAPPPCRSSGKGCAEGGGKISLMDLFYTQGDEELYTTAKPPHEIPALRRALLASRKETRRTDLLGRPCGPMVGVFEPAPVKIQGASTEELLAAARRGGTRASA